MVGALQQLRLRMWDAFAPGGMGNHTKEQSHIFTINLFSLLTSLTFGIFGVVELIEGQQLVGILELFGCLTIILNAIGLRFSKNTALARNLLLLVILVYVLTMLMTGGIYKTGIFWYFLFPVSAFFLAGKYQGLLWMLGLIGATILLRILEIFHVVDLLYEAVTIRQLLLSVSIVSIGIFFYELSREGAEHQIQKEQDELDQAKNEFLALASHQLRTPISAIAWYSEMMIHGDVGDLKESQIDHVKQIYASNQRSTAIVDAMITVTNLQAGPLAMHVEKVDLSTLCSRIINSQKDALQGAKNLNVIEKYESKLKLSCDPSLMRTIIQNLVSNAFKYTPDGGTVIVAVSQSDTKLRKTSKGSIVVRVEDTGYGIPSDQQSRIFAKLFRASNIKAKDTDGTGLGLYIVKTVLEQVGGKVEFQSQENKGSVFTVTLPLEGMSQTYAKGESHV